MFGPLIERKPQLKGSLNQALSTDVCLMLLFPSKNQYRSRQHWERIQCVFHRQSKAFYKGLSKSGPLSHCQMKLWERLTQIWLLFLFGAVITSCKHFLAPLTASTQTAIGMMRGYGTCIFPKDVGICKTWAKMWKNIANLNFWLPRSTD